MDTSDSRKEQIAQATEQAVAMEQTVTELLDAQQMAAAKAIAEKEEALQMGAEFIAEDEARRATDVLTQQLKEARPVAETVTSVEPERTLTPLVCYQQESWAMSRSKC